MRTNPGLRLNRDDVTQQAQVLGDEGRDGPVLGPGLPFRDACDELRSSRVVGG